MIPKPEVSFASFHIRVINTCPQNRDERFSKRVIAPWLAGKSLKTKDAVRLDLGGLGTVGRVLG